MKIRIAALAVLVIRTLSAQIGAPLSPVPLQQPLDNSGRTLGGSCLYTYAAGTTNQQLTYSDKSLMVANSDPVVINAFGRLPAIYLSSVAYKFVLAYPSQNGNCPGSPGNVIWSQDNVYDVGALLKVLLAGPTGAAQIGFEQPSGSLTNVAAVFNSIGIFDVGYSTLATGCANVPSGKSLIVTKVWAAVPTQTINCNLYFLPGGSIQPAAAAVVTLSSSPAVPALSKVFDASVGGAGSILLPTNIGPASPVSPEWFGAACASVSGMTDGTVNLAALTAAQRSLPQWPVQNAQGLFMNIGKVQMGTCGLNIYGYPLSGPFLLSPHVTLSGAETGATSIYNSPSFSGTNMFGVINQNGTGQPPNNNFSTGLTNLLINGANTSAVIDGVYWDASLHSHMDQLTIYTRGVAYTWSGTDGAGAHFIEGDIYNKTCGDTTLSGQGLVVPGAYRDTVVDTLENLKFVYVGANGPDAVLGCGSPVGYIPSSMPIVDIGASKAFHINGLNEENFAGMNVIRQGAIGTQITGIYQYMDCITCPINGGVGVLVSALAMNPHVEGTWTHYKYAVVIGEAWAASMPYVVGSPYLTTIVDEYGCIWGVTTAGTSGTTPPAWPGGGASCTGTVTDGGVTWTAQANVSIACDPHIQTSLTYIYANNGLQQNCYIPALSLQPTSLQGIFPTQTGGAGATGLADDGEYFVIYDQNDFWNSQAQYSQVTLQGANFNTTADQLIYVQFPNGYTRFLVTDVTLSNSSIPLTAAVGGVYSAASKGGCLIVDAGQHWQVPAGIAPGFSTLYTVSAPIDIAGGATSCMGYGTAGSTTYNASVFYSRLAGFFVLSLTTPQGVPATADVTFGLRFLP